MSENKPTNRQEKKQERENLQRAVGELKSLLDNHDSAIFNFDDDPRIYTHPGRNVLDSFTKLLKLIEPDEQRRNHMLAILQSSNTKNAIDIKYPVDTLAKILEQYMEIKFKGI